MVDMRELHRLFHLCGYGGLRFELEWWQMVLAGRLLQLAVRWHGRAHAALLAMPPPEA